MKKRIIIAIIITAVVVFLTNKSWLHFSPMSVDFDISGRGICNIEVQLNKENNDKFTEVKSIGQEINLDLTTHTVYFIERARTPKRFRLIVKYAQSPIEIKNIALKRGKYKLDDLNQFTLSEGKLAVHNNTLQIPPPGKEIWLF